MTTAEKTESAEELSKLQRPELNKRAKTAGVENPEGMANKEAVADAIAKAQRSDDSNDRARAEGQGTAPTAPPPPDRPTDTAVAAEQAEAADHRSDVERRRDEQLDGGRVHGAAKKAADAYAKMSPAEMRSGKRGETPIGGRVDNMTRRSDADVLEGHFCVIDFAGKEFGKDAIKGVEALIGEGNAHTGSGDYGIYVGPGMIGEDGYPETARVLLRDEHAAEVTVPYGALRPSQAGGRR